MRANYKNARLGIDYSPQYLERFFRNLLLGEQWDLRSRYLYINPPEEWQNQPNLAAGQVPNKYRTSTPASTPASLPETVERVVRVLYGKQLSVKELMAEVGLKDRKNFIEYSINPAMKQGIVRMLYLDSPRHPRQKYLLTVKGMMLFNQLSQK